MKKFDLLVIGTGPAGGTVAAACAEAGWDVALAESREFGGTCALRGCNPKKVLVHAAQVVDAAKRSDGKLCETGDIQINWSKLIEFKESFVENIPKSSREKFDKKGIKTYLGSPKFISETQLQIGDEIVEPKHVVIATGSKPRPLKIEGKEHLVTSDEFLNLTELPKRVVFIGGGYISFEFAHVAIRAGSEVTILQRGEQPLTGFDEDAVAHLVKKSNDLGMRIQTNSDVTSIKKDEAGKMTVTFEVDGKSETVEADLVVHGAGRVPNIEDLDLEKGGVEFDPGKGILVDQHLRSQSNPRVIAAGDCSSTDAAELTPTANTEAAAAVKTLLSGTDADVIYGPVPAVAFTIPAIASVGLTEAQAKKENRKFKVSQKDVSDWGSVRKVCETVAYYKILIDESSGEIIGAHLIGPGVAEVINVFAVAMQGKVTADVLETFSFAFPTFSYNIREMVQA